jgi:hypothetical protein
MKHGTVAWLRARWAYTGRGLDDVQETHSSAELPDLACAPVAKTSEVRVPSGCRFMAYRVYVIIVISDSAYM